MSVTSRATARRWASALAGTVAVALATPALARLPVQESDLDAGRLLAMARGSSDVAHQGLVETAGSLGLPDLPRLGGVAALLGGTTRARVWWRSPAAWRVDRITATGESGSYAIPGGVQTWDFERSAVERSIRSAAVHLPRVDDLLPPQAARRALAGVTARDRVSALPARKVAGRQADGVRIVPADRSSTVARLDLYVDVRTGLPLSLLVMARGSSVPALRTAFVELSLSPPALEVLRAQTPPFSRVRTTSTPDLAAAVDRFAPFALPARLGGSPRSRGVVGSGGGSATYGRGLARFVLLPLPPRLGRPAIDAATDGGGTVLDVGGDGDGDGEAVLIATPLLNAVVAHSHRQPDGSLGRRGRSYLLAGTVDAATLHAAVRELVADPPPLR